MLRPSAAAAVTSVRLLLLLPSGAGSGCERHEAGLPVSALVPRAVSRRMAAKASVSQGLRHIHTWLKSERCPRPPQATGPLGGPAGGPAGQGLRAWCFYSCGRICRRFWTMWPLRGASEDGRDFDDERRVGTLAAQAATRTQPRQPPLTARRQEVRPTAGSGEDPPPGSFPLCAHGAERAGALVSSSSCQDTNPTVCHPRDPQRPPNAISVGARASTRVSGRLTFGP